MIRTKRDDEIIRTLTLKIHILTLSQIIKTWWKSSSTAKDKARKRMHCLKKAGLIKSERVLVYPMLPLERPVFVWSPGDIALDYGDISNKLKQRWTSTPQTATVYCATQKSVNQFGGYVNTRQKYRDKATHDLHVSELYLQLYCNMPEIAANWVGEDQLGSPSKNEILPDAALKDEQGKIQLIIEFAGAYNAKRVKKIHEYCAAGSLSYELW